MSFTDFGLKNLRADGPAPPTSSGLDNYVRDPPEQPEHPELRVPAAAAVQPVLGVLQRRHPRRPRRGRRGPAQHQGTQVQAASTGRSSSCPWSSRRSSWPRSGGTCSTRTNGAVNTSSRRSAALFRIPPDCLQHRLAAPGQGPDPVHPAAARVLRAADGELRGWAGRSTRSSRPARCRASRGELYEAAEIDGANALAEVQDRDGAVPPAGDAARTRSTAS